MFYFKEQVKLFSIHAFDIFFFFLSFLKKKKNNQGTYEEYSNPNARYEWPLRMIAINPMKKLREVLINEESSSPGLNKEDIGVATTADT